MDALNSATDSLTKGSGALADDTHGRKKTVHRCQLVLENLYDSYNGYNTCADDCKDLELKILFQQVAADRSDLIDQLSSALKSDFGIEP